MILLLPIGLRVDTGRTGHKASGPARTFSEFFPDCRRLGDSSIRISRENAHHDRLAEKRASLEVPSKPAFSGPLIDKAKWFRISSSDTLSVR